MTTIEAPPDEWAIPAEFAAHWGVAATEIPGDDGRIAGFVFTAPRTLPTIELPQRHRDVLRLMADGLSNAEIGGELALSEDAVKTCARILFRRLGAETRAEAVAIGFRTGHLS